MRSLPSPTITTQLVVDACLRSLRPGPLKDGLTAAAGQLVGGEVNYLQHAANGTLFAIPEAATVGSLDCDQMQRIYKNTFIKSTRTRHLYDVIKTQPENDICPLCGQRTVSTLDHYLAQTRHPSLVVTPCNLVPACADCNKTKLDSQPTSAEEQTFHPYFDDFNDGRWLHATVQHTSPARLVFRAEPPTAWPIVKRERAIRHFDSFHLGGLYASHSAVELTNIRFYLSDLAASGASAAIPNFLSGLAQSNALVQPNSWQTATYIAFAESEWFCAGGFALV